jgi:amino acid transporter
MHDPANESRQIDDDVKTLHGLGYAQELLRRMSGFSNFAISFSIICILAGGVTTFHFGLCGVGGAAFGIGWPLVCLYSLAVAATMGQLASAFPTAGGLYHWASILGGKGWGWATAWFNLAGLVTVMTGINAGLYLFLRIPIGELLGFPAPANEPSVEDQIVQAVAVALITASQAALNHLGIRVVTLLTDFSGYWIMVMALILTVAALACAPHIDVARLVTFSNFSGAHCNNYYAPTDDVLWLFALGFLLPAYTVSGFDASAHTAEETVGAAIHVPRGIVRSVLVSGIFGWIMLCAIVVAIPSMERAAAAGEGAFHTVMTDLFPPGLAIPLYVGIGIAQYLCGLATVTSASRMAYAFARDGGLPFSSTLRQVSNVYRTPPYAIWTVAIASVLFAVYTPVYSTIITACTIFLYISYIIPTALGFWAYGRTWTRMGPWQVGWLYRPLAVICVAGGVLLIGIGMAPPNEKAVYVVAAMAVVLVVVWFAWERKRFPGPPRSPDQDSPTGANQVRSAV